MVICPRCEQQVDETVRTTCPLCFTPLPIPGNEQAAAPQETPQAAPGVPGVPPMSAAQMPPTPPAQAPGLPPMPGGMPAAGAPPPPPNMMGVRPQQTPSAPPPAAHRHGVRVSLTGEVIDDSMQQSAPPPSYVGGNLPTQHPMPAAGPARPTAPAARRGPVVEAPAKSGGGAAIAVVVVLVLALLGGGGWWFMTHRTNPKDQARKFLTAVKSNDWNTIYSLVYLNPEDKKQMPDGKALQAAYDKQMAQLGALGDVAKMAVNSMEIKNIGEPVFGENGEASVQATIKFSVMGQSSEQAVPLSMKNEMGIWKVKQGGAGMGGFGGGMGGFGGGGGGAGMMGGSR